MKLKKPTIGIYGISGCAGCLLTFLYEECFKQLTNLVEIKSFPLIKEETYRGPLDYIFVEGTVCFDKDVVRLKEFRKRAKYIIALGTCAHLGGVPSIKNFLNNEKTMKLVYPKYNYLKSTNPEPIDKYIKVDYYLPQCPPDKREILEFIKQITVGKEFKPYTDSVCLECRKKGNLCLLEVGKICLGPITNGGCGGLCPSKNTECYGCRGPCKDANMPAYQQMLEENGFTKKQMLNKINTFAGLEFRKKK